MAMTEEEVKITGKIILKLSAILIGIIAIVVIGILYCTLIPMSNISKGIKLSYADGYGIDSWSPDGKLLMYHNDRAGIMDHDILIMDGNGKNRQLITSGKGINNELGYCAWFPDSRHVAYGINNDPKDIGEIWITDIKKKDKKRILMFEDARISEIKVSPDGKTIAYIKEACYGGEIGVWVVHVDGNINRKLLSEDDYHTNFKWRPDGKGLYYVKEIELKKGNDDYPYVYDLYAIDIDGRNNRLVLSHSKLGEKTSIDNSDGGYLISADGKQMLYYQWSESSYQNSIHVVNLDGSNNRYLFSYENAKINEINPSWTAICSEGEKLEIVDFKKKNKNLMIEEAHTLLEASDIYGSYSHDNVSWSPDGNKIAYIRQFQEQFFGGREKFIWIADISEAR
jgi:Tol biopolymer transport system component